MCSAFDSIANLPAPAHYFPIQKARYSAGANLHRFGTDFGNGILDRQLFQFDTDYPRYRQNTLAARHESLDRYYCQASVAEHCLTAASKLVSQQLASEHPESFSLSRESNMTFILDCSLSDEQLRFDADWQLLAVSGSSVQPGYRDAMDALASQVQEDITLMCIDSNDTARLCLAHLCAANHWTPADKLNNDMHALHAAVPEFATANPAAERLLTAAINKGPYIRFAWGISSDQALNQHPQQPQQAGRHCTAKTELFMRIERQVIWPLRECNGLLFTIHTSFRDCRNIKKDVQQFAALLSAINNMSETTAHYKGLDKSLIVNILEGL